MKNSRLLPLVILVIAWCVFAAYVWLTAAQLPERVATHFGASGRADGWMRREGYVQFTLLMGTALPAFMVGLFAFIRRCAGWGLNIPHKDYWLAPERREETFDFIQRQGYWLAVLLIGFFAMIHHSILTANARSPATLSIADASWIGAGYLIAMITWIAIVIARFYRKPA